MLDIGGAWANLLAHEGEVFRQIRGGEFTYRVKGKHLRGPSYIFAILMDKRIHHNQ